VGSTQRRPHALEAGEVLTMDLAKFAFSNCLNDPVLGSGAWTERHNVKFVCGTIVLVVDDRGSDRDDLRSEVLLADASNMLARHVFEVGTEHQGLKARMRIRPCLDASAILEERCPRMTHHLVETDDRVGDAVERSTLTDDVVVLFQEA
jgi:hypothetical protein